MQTARGPHPLFAQMLKNMERAYKQARPDGAVDSNTCECTAYAFTHLAYHGDCNGTTPGCRDDQQR